MRGQDLTTGSIFKQIWTLAWPVMLSMFFQTMYNAVDAFWVGKLSPDAIAAVSISQITLFVMVALSLGITVGSGVAMAMHIGAGNKERAEKVLGQSFVLNGIAAVVFTTISLTLRRALLTASGATGDVFPLALDYFTIVAAGSIFLFLFLAVIFGFNSQGDNKTVTVLFAISTGINIILDPVLIFGWLGLPALGIQGAAIATLFSQFLLLVMGLYFLSVKDMMVKLRLRNLRLDFGSVAMVLSIGLPASITQVIGPLGLAAVTYFVASGFQEAGTIAFSIGFRIEFFSFLPAIGFGAASMAMLGQNIGARNLDRAREAYRSALLFGAAIGTGLGLVVFVLARPIIALFTSDPQVTEYAVSYFRTVPLTYGLFVMMFVEVSSFQGMGKSWYGLGIGVLRLAVAVPASYVLVQGDFGITTVWVAIALSNIVSAAIGYVWIGSRMRRLGVPEAAPAGAGAVAAVASVEE